jgi:hypothetical protein
MEYTKLEAKIIAKAHEAFREELTKASAPIAKVLKKYKVRSNSPVLIGINLHVPYIHIGHPNDSPSALLFKDVDFSCLNDDILEGFLKEVEALKERVEDLDINC